MKIRLAYGRTGLPIELPDSARVRVVEPRFTPGLPDPRGALRRALAEPIGSPPCRSGCAPATRWGSSSATSPAPPPYPLMLPALREELAALPDEPHRALQRHRHPPAQHPRGAARPCWAPRRPAATASCRTTPRRRRARRASAAPRGAGEIRLHREFMDCDLQHAHRLHRAALLRRLLRRGQGGDAGPGWARHGHGQPRRASHRPPAGALGRHARQPDLGGDGGGGAAGGARPSC